MQIIPVLLLAVVIEARLFKFSHADAIPGVKAARAELRKTMNPVIYWMWRAWTAYRRNGVSTTINMALAGGLASAEIIGLVLLAYDREFASGGKTWFVVVVGIGVVMVAVKPVYDQLIRQNVQLVEMERDLVQAMAAKAAADVEAESGAKASEKKGKSRRKRG